MVGLWVWLIGAIVLAFWALHRNSVEGFNTANYFGRLAIIAVWIFGGVFLMVGAQ